MQNVDIDVDFTIERNKGGACYLYASSEGGQKWILKSWPTNPSDETVQEAIALIRAGITFCSMLCIFKVSVSFTDPPRIYNFN